MTKSGLSEATSKHIRTTAEFLLPAHTDDLGEIDKGAVQNAVFRELFAPEDREKVAAAVGEGKTSWLFEGIRFSIYELIRHKIRNLHQNVERTDGPGKGVVQIREIQQVFAGPTTRVAKLTLRLTPIETQLVIDQYDKSIKRMQWERRKFSDGLKKMRADDVKYPNLGTAWGVKAVPKSPKKTVRKRRQTPSALSKVL